MTPLSAKMGPCVCVFVCVCWLLCHFFLFGSSLLLLPARRREALNPQQRDQLFLQSCEGILEHLRRQERNLLARKRTEEFQDQRGPMPNWWEIKDTRFSSEVHRNNRSLSQCAYPSPLAGHF